MSLPQWVRDEIDNRWAAERYAQLIREARGWVADCEWADDFEVDELTAEQIKRGIERHYDGGWRAFVADSRPFVSDGA
jgi:hypothetical protein